MTYQTVVATLEPRKIEGVLSRADQDAEPANTFMANALTFQPRAHAVLGGFLAGRYAIAPETVTAKDRYTDFGF